MRKFVLRNLQPGVFKQLRLLKQTEDIFLLFPCTSSTSGTCFCVGPVLHCPASAFSAMPPVGLWVCLASM
eukprot:765094-Hanusia_phi.AAC.3